MITGKDVCAVFSALVPLYVAMLVGFGSVRWWKIFTPDQCTGINRFVAVIAIPMLSFNFIASTNPYEMSFKFLAGDSLQKFVILALLILWNTTRFGSVDWTITLFSIFTMPNTLVMGIPLLKAMYGEFSANLMVQIVFLQIVVWTTLLLVLHEYRSAKLLIKEKFSETAGSITTLRVDSDVSSLSGREPLQADIAEIEEDGKLHVMVRRSTSQRGDRSTSSSGEISSTGGQRKRDSDPVVDIEITNPSNVVDILPHETASSKDVHESVEIEEKVTYPLSKGRKKVDNEEGNSKIKQQMPSAAVMARLIIIMVWRKLIRNPNIYAAILGLAWSLIAFRLNVKIPAIVKSSITIISNTGLGMAMFSLGLFMALQPKLVACGKKWAAISMIVRFLGGPAVIAATSAAIGLRGVLLKVEIVQATLPQAIIPFVFAKEYNLHADILSTAVIFGMIVAVPITIIYYVFLGL